MSADMLNVCIIVAVFKKAHRTGTGDGPLSQDMTPAEELALHLNKGRPVMEGIQRGTHSDSNRVCPSHRNCPLHTRYIL